MHFKVSKQAIKKFTPLIAGSLLILIAGTVIIGWFIGSDLLIRISKTFAAMVFNTALSFFCMGLALIFLHFRWKWISRLFALFVFILNFLITMQYVFKTNLYVDNLFFTYNLKAPMTFPGRTSINTSLTLSFGAFALFFSTYPKTYFRTFLIVLLSCLGLAIPFTNIIGYVSGIESAANWTSFSKMAVHTAICSMIMNASILTCSIIDILGTPIQGIALSIAVSLTTVFATTSFWRLISTKDFTTARLVSEYEVSEIDAVTEQIFRENIDALRRFAQRWEAEQGYSSALWQIDSRNYLEDLKPLTSIQIADTNFKIVEQTAIVKSEYFANIEQYTRQIKLLKQGKIALYYDKDSEELDIFIPIFRDKKLYEFLFASLDVPMVFEMALKSLPLLHNNVIFSIDHSVLYAWNFTDAKSLGPPVVATINEEYVPVTIQITVDKNVNQKGNSAIQWIVIFTGIFAAFISAGIVYFYFRSREQEKILNMANQDLAFAKEKANQATIAKSSFLSSMSHEIRTPLNAVIGTLQILFETELNDTQKKYVRRMEFSSKILLSLLNDILDYSKIEAGSINLDSSAFDLLDTAQGACETLAVKSAEKKVPIYIEAPEQPLPQFIGDAHRFEQIFINLINNALKFTEQGEVALKLQVKSTESNRYLLRCEVVDTGVGIAPIHQKKLFEKFTQVHASDARKSKGVGLGLSICKGLVEKMNGQIGIVSEEGKGATFWFEVSLPVAKPDEKITPYQLTNFSVLLLDSSERQRNLIHKYLQAWGAQIETAYSDQLHNISLAIVSTDQGESLQKIKDKNWPMLYLENADPSKVGDDILHKPISPKSLWMAIQHKIGK